MTRFTDSLYERLMTQIPNERRGGGFEPPAVPPGPPGPGCPYGRNTPCLGVCFRKLIRRE